MNTAHASNRTERFKRNWLNKIMLKSPKHQLTYFPLLTDENHSNRENLVDNFIDDMTSRGIKVKHYNGLDQYSKQNRYEYTRKFLLLYKKNGSNDEIIFADPTTGFYSSNVSTVKYKKHIDMKMIEILLDGISDSSIIYCFQYNQNNTYTKGIEEGIEAYIVDNNLDIEFTMDKEFISAAPQLKFYKFQKKKFIS